MPTNGSQKRDREGLDQGLVGTALLSNTTACEASRLIEMSRRGPDSLGEYGDVLRIADLISLIDAVVLHEQIFFLPASLPDDVSSLELRNRLTESGALAPFPRHDDRDAVGRALLATLSTTDGLAKVAGSADVIGQPLAFATFQSELADALHISVGNAPASPPYEGEDEGLYAPVVASEAETFDEAARELIGWLDYRASGAYGGSMASLRAMYYVFAAEHHGLPYLPSTSVERVIRGFPNYFSPLVRETLYKQLASALRVATEKVAAEFGGAIMFVPPFAALVLDRAATPGEIPSETLALREEYRGFRSRMSELEHERAGTASLEDRLKALGRMERLGKEVARPFGDPATVNVETTLRYIPDAVDLAANPTNPVGWARMLLDKPADMLINWYRRRPIAKLLHTAKDVVTMKGYDHLLTKHFGEEAALRVLSRNR